MYVTRRLQSQLVLLNAEEHPNLDDKSYWQDIANRLIHSNFAGVTLADILNLNQALVALMEEYGRAFYILHEEGCDFACRNVERSGPQSWLQITRRYAWSLGLIEDTLREVEKVISRECR